MLWKKAAESNESKATQMRKKLDTMTAQLDEARVQCGLLEETLNENNVEVDAYRTKIEA